MQERLGLRQGLGKGHSHQPALLGQLAVFGGPGCRRCGQAGGRASDPWAVKVAWMAARNAGAATGL